MSFINDFNTTLKTDVWDCAKTPTVHPNMPTLHTQHTQHLHTPVLSIPEGTGYISHPNSHNHYQCSLSPLRLLKPFPLLKPSPVMQTRSASERLFGVRRDVNKTNTILLRLKRSVPGRSPVVHDSNLHIPVSAHPTWRGFSSLWMDFSGTSQPCFSFLAGVLAAVIGSRRERKGHIKGVLKV